MNVLNFPAKAAPSAPERETRNRLGFASIDDLAHGAMLVSWLALTVAVVVRTI